VSLTPDHLHVFDAEGRALRRAASSPLPAGER
jgi:hypothetical protein